MSGRPRGTRAKTEVLRVRLDPVEMAAVDKDRGTSTRSAYIRRLIRSSSPLTPTTPQKPPHNGATKTPPQPTETMVVPERGTEPAKHRHTRHHKYADDTFAQGHRVEHWACQCGWALT